MASICLPEYHAEAGDAFLLHVTIKFERAAAAAYLQQRLHSFIRQAQIVQDVKGWLLFVEALPTADTDQLLKKIALEVDRLSELSGQAELLESRIIPTDQRVTKARPEMFGLQLESGNAFGTGLHPSTNLALTALSELSAMAAEFPASVLDVGCGTGILALVSARHGARRVHGIDISNEAVAVASRNVAANNFSDRIMINEQPLDQIAACFDLITANLTSSVLMRLAPQFAGRLNSRGFLIVSGIQGRQSAEITALLYKSAQFAVLKQYASGPWRTVLYRLV